jgi:hypothetical protein
MLLHMVLKYGLFKKTDERGLGVSDTRFLCSAASYAVE